MAFVGKQAMLGKHFFIVSLKKFQLSLKNLPLLSISVIYSAQQKNSTNIPKNRQTFKRALQLNGDRVRKECHCDVIPDDNIRYNVEIDIMDVGIRNWLNERKLYKINKKFC